MEKMVLFGTSILYALTYCCNSVNHPSYQIRRVPEKAGPPNTNKYGAIIKPLTQSSPRKKQAPKVPTNMALYNQAFYTKFPQKKQVPKIPTNMALYNQASYTKFPQKKQAPKIPTNMVL